MKLFFSTELAACPYLPDRRERRLVTALDGQDPDRLHDRLMQAGFRRSQGLAYRPACPGCEACVPVRIPVARFRLTRPWRRILLRNRDLAAVERPPAATREQFGLFQRYLASRHGESGMAGMSWPDYCAMIEDSPVDSLLVEWRRPDQLAARREPHRPHRERPVRRLQVLRSGREPPLARHARDPLARAPRPGARSALRLSRLLDRRQPEDGLQGALPPARAADRARLARDPGGRLSARRPQGGRVRAVDARPRRRLRANRPDSPPPITLSCSGGTITRRSGDGEAGSGGR